MQLEFLKLGSRKGEKQIFEEIMSKHVPNLVSPQILRFKKLNNPKHKKHEENYIRTHHDQIAQKQ